MIVDHRLRGHLIRGRNIKLAVQNRVTGGIFVHVCRAVAYPLAGDEHRKFDVQFYFAHLKGGRMPVPHQITDQPFVVLYRFGALAITDPRRLANGCIIAHIIYHPHKAVIQHGISSVQMAFHTGADGPQCGLALGALGINFSQLIRRQRHGRILFSSESVPLYLGQGNEETARSMIIRRKHYLWLWLCLAKARQSGC